MFFPFLGFVNVNVDANNSNLNTSLFDNYSMAKVQSELELLNYESEYCDVTFDCNGGKYNSNNMFIVTVIQGELMNEPDKNNLKKLNSTFIGWYTLDGEKWNFEKDACGIKIEVVKNNPTTDYNRGRVIIGNINLFY